MELDLAYAMTIHKSQGSEFEAVIIPVLTQHFKMLFRNLIYTGLTRAQNWLFLSVRGKRWPWRSETRIPASGRPLYANCRNRKVTPSPLRGKKFPTL